MAEGKSVFVQRRNDRAVLDFFKAIYGQVAPSETLTIWPLGTAKYNESFEGGELSEKSNELVALNSVFIERAILTFNVDGQSSRIEFVRGGAQDKKNQFSDEVVLQGHSNNPINIDITKFKIVYKAIETYLVPYNSERAVSLGLGPDFAEFQAIHASTLERLETVATDVVSRADEYRARLDEKFLRREAELEEKFDKKVDVCEENFREKFEELVEREKKLALEKERLEDKTNTFARREIRRDILTELQKRTTAFELTKGTREMRIPIALMLSTLLFVFLSGATVAGYEFFSMLPQKDYLLLAGIAARQILYSFGFFGTAIYFVRWLNRWLEQHAQAEFQFKQLQLDIERASWVVETALEWNDVKGSVMPEQLLESLTKNLFVDKSLPIEPALHPADQLASALLGTASSIRLKAGDSEVDINPKKLEKAQ